MNVPESTRSLRKYKDKRDFTQTPEPVGKKKGTGKIYVVQKHDATRLHYDLRLEHRGVLLSWAVPKEPSLDPSVKRLAVRVEDHPIDYATFEGTIPKGNYGAGTVEIWDRGTWDTEDDVEQALADGKLSFELYGDRLHGSFALVRMGDPGEKENWLLMKHKGVELKSPGFMLCRPVEKPPTGPGWIHEIKWDGYRAMALVVNGNCRILSRGGNEIEIPDLQSIIGKAVEGPAIIDGELVVFSPEGPSDFGMLQATLKSDKKSICFVAFDLLLLGEDDLRDKPIEARREMLLKLLPKKHARLRFSEDFESDNVFKAACELGLEGIVSKRKGSSYRVGRFDDWRKAKCSGHEEFIVGGFTIMANTTRSVGSLIVGQEVDGKLVHRGRLGTFDEKTRSELFNSLDPLRSKEAPFEIEDPKDRKGAHWVLPRMRVKGKFLNKTSKGVVRQARFDGVLEMTEPGPDLPTRFKVTSGDRIVDKVSGATKQALADYYVAVLDRIFPQLQNRPVSVIRCPEGVDHACFFQRHVKHEIPGTIQVPLEDESYVGIGGPEGILGMVQYGGIEFHPWGAQVGDVKLPDRLIFDLDPGPDVSWKRVLDSAQLLRERLESIGLIVFLKLSGGKGLHLVTPIKPELDWDQAKAFTKALAESLVRDHPSEFVSKMSKSIRNEKIFVDYLRNDQTSTAVSAYSLRAKANLPCAWPIRWDDVTISNFQDYLNEPDPWLNMPKASVSLKKILKL